MKEAKKEELRVETKQISDIMFVAQESFKIVKYILEDDADHDVVYAKNMTAYFQWSMKMHWRITVIELSKLFSDRESERYNLTKFMGKLKRAGYFGDANISEVLIRKWEELLTNEKNAIDNLIEQRDKVYAHTDSGSIDIANSVSMTKISHLIDIIQGIIREIYISVYEMGIVFDPIPEPVQSLKWIIGILAENKKSRESHWKISETIV